MDQSFQSSIKNDLSFLLASPKKDSRSNIKSKLDQMDMILKSISTYNTEKVDIEQMNKEAKLEAKKVFYEEIDNMQLPAFNQLEKFDQMCSQVSKGLKKQSIFKYQPLVLYKKDEFYANFDEKIVREILSQEVDKLEKFKKGLKMISLESNLNNLLVIKKVFVDQVLSVSIEDIYTTLFKILINFGIDLELMKRYVSKYLNIKDNESLKQLNKKKNTKDEEYDLNIIQSFIHIVDLIEISVNSTLIQDRQILADFVFLVLILFSEQHWRFNETCLSSLDHLFILILKRANRSQSTITLISKCIIKFFKDNHSLFFEFLDFFPDHIENLKNIKSGLCKRVLKKYHVKIGHSEEQVDCTFEKLKVLKSLNIDEFKLILTLVDHFYRTSDLSDALSQHISDRLSALSNDFEFEFENQNSIEFTLYLKSLIDKFDMKPKSSPRRKKVKGEHQSRVRKVAMNEKEVKKIWEQVEDDLDD